MLKKETMIKYMGKGSGINIIGIPLIAFIINLFLKEQDREEIYRLAQEKNKM